MKGDDVMNELMIHVENSWIIFKTTKTKVYDALIDFEEKMSSVGINHDNMLWDEAILRDADGNDISYLKMENGVVIG